MHVVLTPRHSGAECLVYSLAKIEVSWGDAVSVVSLNPCDEAFQEQMGQLSGVGVDLAIPRVPLQKVGRVLWIYRAVERFNPDVIFAHSVIPAAYTRVACIRKRDPRVISVLHDATQDDYADAKIRWAEHVLKWRSDGIIAVSALQATNYSRRFKTFPKENVKAIANGVATKRLRFERERQQMKRSAADGKNSEGILILQIGRIAKSKNQLMTVRALEPLLKDDPRIKVFLVGQVEEREYAAEVQNAIASLGLAGRVVMQGPRSDVAELLGGADVCVLPSRIEAHSVAMLEALASGIPIVASKIPVFSSYGKFAGVYLFRLTSLDEFRLAVKCALENRTTWQREMCVFDIEKTASDYASFAMTLIAAYR